MGLALWAAETLLVAVTGYAWAARLTLSGFLERAMVAILLAVADVLAIMYGLGAVGGLIRGPVALTAFLVNGVALAFALSGDRLESARSAIASDARAPLRLLRDVREHSELSAYVFPIAVLAVLVSCLIIWRFPSWSWDCVWYHVPMANYAVTLHGNDWVDTNIFYINGYPRNVELLSAWNTVLIGDTRLDDAAQMPFALLGALAIAAFSRRLKANPSVSASAGAMWIITPAVCLQMHTTHADIAAGALFVAGMYVLSAPSFSRTARWLTFLIFGLYAGSKVTGLFHLLLISPILVVRIASVAWKSSHRRQVFVELLLQIGVCVLAGGFSYVRNALRFSNPFWPVHISIPLLGTLPGPIDPRDMAWPPAFFGAPGAFQHMLRQWYTPSQNYYPDVREGPFGLLFPWLTLPTFLLMGLLVPFGREKWQRLAVLVLGVLAIQVPVAWWGRYTLAMPAAALIAFAAIHAQLRAKPLQAILSAAAAFLAVASYTAATQGYRALPTPFADQTTRQQDERRLRAEIDWLWPYPVAQERDRALRPGDTIIYDSATSFLAEFWTPDLRNRAVYLEHDGDDSAYLERLRKLRPVWLAVGAGSRAEQLLRSRGDLFEFWFPLPRSDARMYRATRPNW